MGKSLNRVSPAYQNARRTATVQQIIPASYHADYLGHKIHVNKKEKLFMYGVICIMWQQYVYGFSGMIVGFLTIPVRNLL